jgi:hypothetical protein
VGVTKDGQRQQRPRTRQVLHHVLPWRGGKGGDLGLIVLLCFALVDPFPCYARDPPPPAAFGAPHVAKRQEGGCSIWRSSCMRSLAQKSGTLHSIVFVGRWTLSPTPLEIHHRLQASCGSTLCDACPDWQPCSRCPCAVHDEVCTPFIYTVPDMCDHDVCNHSPGPSAL